MKAKILNILFFTVALKGLLIGAYHLYLPTHWQWQAGLTQTPEILQWALMALNDMWSALIILLHGGLLVCFKKGLEVKQYQLGFILAIYWALHALIITINPIPMPQHLQWLSRILIMIPYLQSSILILASWTIRANSNAKLMNERQV
ncbi:MAG: hypothetical protein KUG78_03305 [Kangiellaceae bacterium]|nr:hypothetical protein [Kangiellaceae bacterium]